jgi:excisionase family DNA binding protein
MHNDQPAAAAPGPFLNTREVADLLRVDPDTVSTWARTGRITAVRTPGGYWRIPEADVQAILNGQDPRV